MIAAGLAILALVLVWRAPAERWPPLPSWLLGVPAFAAGCATLAATFAASVLLDAACDGRTAGVAGLPFATLPPSGIRLPLQSNVAALAAVVQSMTLGCFVLRMRVRPLARLEVTIVAAFACCALLLAAIVPSARSADIYVYAGYTLLPDPSAGQHAAFPHGFSAITALWGYPFPSTVYGPLWHALAHAATSALPTLSQRLYALRALGVFAVVLGTLAYARLRDASTALALFALNPAILNAYAVDAHNDAWGIALLLFALHPKSPQPIRWLFAAAAGAFKYPFVVAGAIVFDGPLWWRIVAPASIALATIGLALATHSGFSTTAASFALRLPLGPFGTALHLEGQALCALVLILAIVAKRFIRFGGVSFGALGLEVVPWYLGWGLPYQVRAGFDRGFLVLFPVLANALDTSYQGTLAHDALFAVIGALALGAALRVGPFRDAEVPMELRRPARDRSL